MAWAGEFQTRQEALAFEHQVKGWNRAKKEALSREDWSGIHEIVKAERKRREVEKKSNQQTLSEASRQASAVEGRLAQETIVFK